MKGTFVHLKAPQSTTPLMMWITDNNTRGKAKTHKNTPTVQFVFNLKLTFNQNGQHESDTQLQIRYVWIEAAVYNNMQ